MAEAANVSLGNILTDPSYDFLQCLSKENVPDAENMYLPDSPYDDISILCSYMDETRFSNTYSNNPNLAILTLNIQSLPSKFTEFSEFIRSLQISNSAPDIICLQELWQFPDPSMFTLPGYNELIYKLRRNHVQGGGVGIYVKSGINFTPLQQLSVFVDRVFESIFIEIKPANCNKIIIGSAYRPGSKHPGLSTVEQFSQFSDLFSNLCNELSSLNYPVYLAGDINLDVLLYNSNPKVTEYINLLFSFGFLQTVTHPA
jgi:hypothetical protein